MIFPLQLGYTRTALFVLSAVITASLVLYIFFLFLSVMNVSLRAAAEESLSKELSKASALDAEYLALSRKATLAEAKEAGLVEVHAVHFRTRAGLASSRLSQDTLR